MGRTAKRRMVMHGPSTASGGTTTWTRDPSAQAGVDQGVHRIGPPTERGDDALDEQLDLRPGRARPASGDQPTVALDPDRDQDR